MRSVVIWDFNGTIVDDTRLCFDIEMKMLERRGMYSSYTVEEYRRLFCFPVIDYYHKLGYTFEHETYREVSDEFNRYYDEQFAECGMVPGALEKIRESCAKGYRNVIVSATEQKTLEDECRKLGISEYFSNLIGIDDNMAYSKTVHAARWMETSGIDPDTCFLLGDTLHDLETAEKLGIKDYLLVACGHQAYEVLRKKTEKTVHELAEVIL